METKVDVLQKELEERNHESKKTLQQLIELTTNKAELIARCQHLEAEVAEKEFENLKNHGAVDELRRENEDLQRKVRIKFKIFARNGIC